MNLIKTSEVKIKKSLFIGQLYDIVCLDEIQKILNEQKIKHKKATHICYAYRFNAEMIHEKSFDDGEPSGTAGKPILNVIKKKNLTNTMIVVVRYFGGIKLGAGGLIRAYTKCASMLVSGK